MSNKLRSMIVAASLTLAALIITASPAQAGVKVGDLSCHEASGWGFVFGSSRDLHCTFSGGTYQEHYIGKINKFGIDIGYQQSGVILWEVIAPGTLTPGALTGSYGGVTASAAVVLGVGANALIGGSGNSIALQPLSVEGATGINVAVGIGEITLVPQP